ncbi:phosphotransferase [Luteimonas salinilitoris]|uniref:Phosphotransferase n=1 Tax=Luteimonas salinilitoris TaxID=3237697 RepID=A0ABV4HVS0_9GAMM
MVGRDEIQALIPHQGAMCLWDEVIEWDPSRIVLRADNHRGSDHPLRSGGRLRAIHLCEYSAQAMAVHGGLLASADGGSARPGRLVALRQVALHAARIDGLPGSLQCEAHVLAQTQDSQQYGFRIWHQDTLLAEGRAAAMLR